MQSMENDYKRIKDLMNSISIQKIEHFMNSELETLKKSIITHEIETKNLRRELEEMKNANISNLQKLDKFQEKVQETFTELREKHIKMIHVHSDLLLDVERLKSQNQSCQNQIEALKTKADECKTLQTQFAMDLGEMQTYMFQPIPNFQPPIFAPNHPNPPSGERPRPSFQRLFNNNPSPFN